MKYRVVSYLLLLYPLLSATPLAAQNVSFSKKVQANAPYIFATADLNNDGREDLIGSCASGDGSLGVALSNGDGTYAPQVCYPAVFVYRGGIAVGDFNGDGHIDLAVSNANQSNTIYEYLNNGDGSLHLQASFVTQTQIISSIVAADVNHDGRMDLVWDGYNDTNLYVYFGNADGGFSVGPTSTIQVPGTLSVGDFDGDGNADILSQFNTYGNSIQVDYGDGHGHFQETPVISDDAYYQPFDLNGDGRMDLVGGPFDFSLNGSTYYKIVRVMFGNSNRTFTTQNIPLSQCTDGGGSPAVADFNGDGIKDIVVAEGSDCKGAAPYTVNVLLGKGDGSYAPEQVIYSSKYTSDLYIMRANRDTKPDVRFFGQLQGTQGTTDIVFLNTIAGNGFPSCDPPNSGTGIALCSPTSEIVASSPVTFNVAAANQTAGRKVEVWIDGQKPGEELNGWSYYSFLDAQYNVSNGAHTVTLYSAGWDNSLESVTFPLMVGSTQCAPPPSPGLNICSPLVDSTLARSVLVWASGTVTGTFARMDVFVDGVKKASTSGSDMLKKNISLRVGTHTFLFDILNTAGQKWQQTVVAVVK